MANEIHLPKSLTAADIQLNIDDFREDFRLWADSIDVDLNQLALSPAGYEDRTLVLPDGFLLNVFQSTRGNVPLKVDGLRSLDPDYRFGNFAVVIQNSYKATKKHPLVASRLSFVQTPEEGENSRLLHVLGAEASRSGGLTCFKRVILRAIDEPKLVTQPTHKS